MAVLVTRDVIVANEGRHISPGTGPQFDLRIGRSHDRFSHYVEKDKLTEALINGTPVIALCGKVWVPSRDPERYPVCPMCRRLYDMGPEGRRREWEERALQEGFEGTG